MTVINAPTTNGYDSDDSIFYAYPSDWDYETEEEYDGPEIPYTNHIIFHNKKTEESTVPTPFEEWAAEKIAANPEIEVELKEMYVGDYIVNLYASHTHNLLFFGREFVLNVEPLEYYEPALLTYNGESVEWLVDDMETTYRKMNDVIMQTETR